MAAAKAKQERDMKVGLEALRKVILDVEKYPEFLSEVKVANLVKGGSAEKFDVDFEIEVLKRFRYRLAFDASKTGQISWTLVESDLFKKNQGRWILKEQAKGTLATYELEVELGFLVPSWVTRKLTEVNLPTLLENFEERAKKTKGKA